MSRSQHRKGGKRARETSEWFTDTRDPASMNNRAFEAYYRGHLVPEEEWETFMATLRESLPMTVRFNLSLPCTPQVDAYLTERLAEEFTITRIPFLSPGHAIQCSVSRGDLKRNSVFKSLKKLVGALNDGGYITRQETVSMLPPWLLQVRPGDRVLDMCAAPGSKTSQILEQLVVGDAGAGVVVANDVNTSRLDILYHQTNRAPGAHAHVIVSNYDAGVFPILPSEEKFDRVLCDVMCSGDGTLRKSMDMWPRWNCNNGVNLHAEQTRVLLRGMANCKKGGIVVYSTCSLNPAEDEAVVSACLRRHEGHFRLIDTSGLVPGLRSSPGRYTWAITTRDLDATLHTYEEAQAYMAREAEKGNKRAYQYKPTMFADPELLRAQQMHLALRILPHAQDTGGFFVAALECVEEVEAPPTAVRPSVFAPVSDEVQAKMRTSLSLPQDFPLANCVARRELSREAKIFYANDAVLRLFPLLGDRVTHVGVKVVESYVKYSLDFLRFSDDAAPALLPLLPPAFVLPVQPELLLELARGQLMLFEDFFARVGRANADYPMHSLLLECALPVVGKVYCTAERSTKFGKMAAKVPAWQVALVHHFFPQYAPPAEAAEEKNESGGKKGDDAGEDDDG